MKNLYSYYRAVDLLQESTAVAVQLAPMLEHQAKRQSGQHASSLWQQAAGVNRHLERGDRCLDCLRRALAITPHDWSLRRRFAMRLVDQEQYTAAAEQLQWCLSRKPNDSNSLVPKPFFWVARLR